MSLDFSGLVNVGGNLNIQYLNDPSYVSHNLSFPLLETIGGYFNVYRFYGDNLIAPSLTTIGDYLSIYDLAVYDDSFLAADFLCEGSYCSHCLRVRGGQMHYSFVA